MIMISQVRRYNPGNHLSAIPLVFLFIVCTSVIAEAKDIPDDLRIFLSEQIGLNQEEISQAQSGQSVSKALPTEEKEEIAVFGLVYINVPSQYFVTHVRNSLYFDSVNGVLQNGVFSSPPTVSDVSELSWETDDLEKIRDCDPSDCTARFPGGDAILFQKEIDWSSSNAMQQANDLMRRLSVEYIKKYQDKGDDALTSYYIDGKFWSVKEGTSRLLANSSYLHKSAPDLTSYLQNYPQENNPDVEHIFYWQKAKFGLQPVIRFNHVVVLPMKNSLPNRYLIASKMLFANHYFRDALELRSLIPDSETAQGFYFLILNRSHVDGMTGFKGLFVRGRAVKKTVEKLQRLLTAMKVRMEQDFRIGE